MELTVEYFESIQATIYQPKIGFRYGDAPLLLANFCKAYKDEKWLEIGAGVGVISLILARRFAISEIVALELQKTLFEILTKNININQMTNRVKPVCDDYRNYCTQHASSFDAIVSNPPFYPASSGKISPNKQKAYAHHELAGTMAELIKYSAHSLKPNGRLYLLYPSKRKKELITRLKQFDFCIHETKLTKGNRFLLKASLQCYKS